MKHEICDGKEVVRLQKYNHIHNKYDSSCMNGFEFTHHDILVNKSDYNALKRRYKRLLALQDVHLFIFYHHRFCESTDIEMLFGHLKELHDLYLKRCREVTVIMFTQVIVNTVLERKVTHKVLFGGEIHVYEFYTLNAWSGNDEDIFWARCDDDLISKMICQICEENLLTTNSRLYSVKESRGQP